MPWRMSDSGDGADQPIVVVQSTALGPETAAIERWQDVAATPVSVMFMREGSVGLDLAPAPHGQGVVVVAVIPGKHHRLITAL